MKKLNKLAIKKITLRDLGQTQLEKVRGGEATKAYTNCAACPTEGKGCSDGFTCTC
jgi:hypothetical protein